MAINNPAKNGTARDRLITALRTGRLYSLTGAGLSAWAGYPTWAEFLERLSAEVARRQESFVDVPKINALIKDPLQRAKKLASFLGSEFQDFFRVEFGPRNVRPEDVMFRFAALPFRHHMTLNFEPSLETALQALERKFGVLSSAREEDLITFLRQMDDPEYPQQVLHLHGSYQDDVNKVVLTEDGYKALYANNPMRSHFLWTLFATRRLVFVGFGFADQDFLGALQNCCRHTELSGENHVHFAIVGLHDDADDEQRRYRLETTYHTDAIFYNVRRHKNGHQDHREFGELMTGIADELSAVEPPPASAPLGSAEPVDADDLRAAAEMTARLKRQLGRGLS